MLNIEECILYTWYISKGWSRTTMILNYHIHTSERFLSHNNPCFQWKCNTAITNFLISNTCEIRFHDVIGQSTVPMYSYAKILKHGRPT